MKKIIAIALTAAALAGCEYVPFTDANRIEAAKKRIAILSANPMTVQWGEVKAGPGGSVCGTFNAQEEGYPVRSELTWTGPKDFVTIDGRPIIANNYEDCDAVVGAWSRCVNDGDTAKVTADVQACKAFQAENERQSREQIARFFGSEGLISSGDHDRDRLTWDERQKQFDKGPQGTYGRELSVQVDSWGVWKRGYNAHMRTLPANATTAQKIAAAGQAVIQANAATEAYLRAEGFRG
jgi:hypothetical protein